MSIIQDIWFVILTAAADCRLPMEGKGSLVYNDRGPCLGKLAVTLLLQEETALEKPTSGSGATCGMLTGHRSPGASIPPSSALEAAGTDSYLCSGDRSQRCWKFSDFV